MDFSKKNNFVVKHKGKQHFDKDYALFKEHFPNHELGKELSRANSFTYESLDSRMLCLLLEKVTPEEIQQNRNGEVKSELSPAEIEKAKKLAKAKAKLIAVGIDIEKVPTDVLEKFSEVDTDAFEQCVKNVVIFQKPFETADEFEQCVQNVLVVLKPFDTVEQVKEKLLQENINIEGLSPEFLDGCVGKTFEEIVKIIETLPAPVDSTEERAKTEETPPAPVVENTEEKMPPAPVVEQKQPKTKGQNSNNKKKRNKRSSRK